MYEGRPPRSNPQQQEQPTSTGIWRFTGTVYVPLQTVPYATQPEIVLENWALKIIAEGDDLIITDPDTGVALGGEWVGWWEKVSES